MVDQDLVLLELRGRLCYWLVQLRWVAVIGTLATVLFSSWLGVTVFLPPLLFLILGIAAYNLFFSLTARPDRLFFFKKPRTCAAVQIVLDLIFLALLLHFSGGIENPFSIYFVFHMVIGSLLLSPISAFVVCCFTLLLFGFIVWGEWVGLLPHYHLHPLPKVCRSLTVVFSNYFALSATLLIVTSMTSFISGRLRKRERQVRELTVSLQERSEQLEEAYRALEEAEQFKSQQMRKMSHELRAPLNAALSIANLLTQDATVSDHATVLRLMKRISARLNEMKDIVNDMLTLSRLREVQRKVERKPVSLKDIVQKSLEKFQPMMREKKLALVSDVSDPVPTLFGSEEALQEMVDNLISNAVRYTPARGAVTVRLRSEGDQVILEVSDTGVGIPPEDLPHIFDEFYRARNAREVVHEGTGLGLSIVRTAAEAHNGRVEVDSRLKVGTTFKVFLPMAGKQEGSRAPVTGYSNSPDTADEPTSSATVEPFQ